MPAAPTMSRPSARQRSRRTGVAVAIVVAVAVTIASLAVISSTLSGPERIDIAIENPTEYELSVEVRGADGGQVHDLGPIAPASTRTFTGVIDQGDTWLFEFSYGGVLAGEITVERSQLESGPVVVPDDARLALEQAELPPSSP